MSLRTGIIHVLIVISFFAMFLLPIVILAQPSSSQSEPGFRPGRTFMVLFIGLAGIAWETFSVLEERGNWIKVKVVKNEFRDVGSTHWLNTAVLSNVYFPDENK